MAILIITAAKEEVRRRSITRGCRPLAPENKHQIIHNLNNIICIFVTFLGTIIKISLIDVFFFFVFKKK